MQNINTTTFNKHLIHHQQQQQQQFLQAQHFTSQIVESNVIDYSLNHSNLAAFNQTTPLNLSQPQQQQYQQYQQKKLNYKSKLKTDDSNKFKRDNQHNDDSNPSNIINDNNNNDNDDDFNDSNYEQNHNLDSSFSNYSYSTEQNELVAKNGTNKKQKPNNKLIIKQEKEDLNDFNNKKRRESYPNEFDQTNDDDDDDDNHNSEMNDDDDDPNTMNDSKEKRTKSDLNCVVCDSPANGYNFDAVTCESCKAFFRRNAFRPINLFRCSNNDSCIITVATRKKCKKCRIAKCFRLGMRRDWIMTEVEREEKRKKIEENRRRKQSNPNVSQVDTDMMMMNGGPASNSSQLYDDYSNQPQMDSNGTLLPVRRRRRRRRNSWFDLNNKTRPPQQQQQQQCPTQQQQQQQCSNKPNEFQQKQSSSATGPVTTEKQNSPLSSSLSSSSSSSSSSLTNRRFDQPSSILQTTDLNESSNPFALHSNLLPLNLITKQSLDNAQNALSNKLTSINQYLMENNNKNSISSPFVLSPTVQQQLQLTFEQQKRQMLLNNNFGSMPALDFSTNSSTTSHESLLKQQYAAAAAVALQQASSSVQMHANNAPFSSAFNLTTSTSNNLPTTDLNSASCMSSILDDKKYTDPRRRRKLKESTDDLNTKLPVTQSDVVSIVDLENKFINPMATPLAVNTLLPSLKYLSKNNINQFNEIKLNPNNSKNESTYISFSEQSDLVRSPRVLSPVSSTSSSSSSSSSSCDQYQFDNTPVKMTDLQRKQVEAIQHAYKQAIQLVKAQGLPKNSQDINTTINLTELAVRRVIFYFKLISDFRELKHDLMVVLLKFNMMSLLQIHGINSYNKEENTYKEPDTDDTPFSAQSIENVYGTSVYELSISITRNLFDLCAGDMTHIKILMLIVLFDPYNEKLSESEKENVAKLQNKYVTLLHAYLCELMGSPRAENTFKSILIEISKINDLGKWFEKTVTEKSSCDFVRPLMKEVFGIATPANSAASTPIASSQPSSIGSSCSAKSNKPIDQMECTNNDSNYETPATYSTSLSDSSFCNNNNNSKYSSSSPNNK